jgi:hypothetical protein
MADDRLEPPESIEPPPLLRAAVFSGALERTVATMVFDNVESISNLV